MGDGVAYRLALRLTPKNTITTPLCHVVGKDDIEKR